MSNMQNPLISVIVPVYKVEEYLDKCVESIVNQTYQNLEIVLVDDGSPDRCPAMCDEWEKEDSRIKVIHKVNGGLSDARNVGLEIIAGEYVAFIDSDDWIESEFIEKLYHALIAYNADVSGCKYRKCTSVLEICDNTENNSVEIYNKIQGLSALIDETIKQVVWNKLYKKEIIEGILFEKEKYHEDEFWSYKVLARSNQYVEIDYVGYNYFQRETSIMGENYSLKRLHAIEAKVGRQRFLEEKYPELASQGKENLLFSCMAHGQAAITQLETKDKEYVMAYLRRVVKNNQMNNEEYKGVKLTHKVWLAMAGEMFEVICKVRNVLGVGV